MDMKQWEDGKFVVDDPVYGEIRLNTNLPIEWQLEAIANEIKCDFCDQHKDCRKCSAFEYSLLHRLIEANK